MGRILKHLAFVVATLLSVTNAFADCTSSGLSVWPSLGAIKKNSVFVLDGYASSMDVIYGLNSRFPIYLKAGNTKIKLNVKETCTGQFYLAQAILVPASKLEAGKEYELCIDNLPQYQSVRVWNPRTGDYIPPRWTVSTEEDNNAPQWLTMPKEKSKSYAMFGCGPSIHVNFSFAVSEQSEYLVKTTIKSLQTGKRTTYYIGVSQKEISVGHGMCSGAFNFGEGENYEVEFSLMDASGNFAQSPTCGLIFTRPKPEKDSGR